MKPKVLICLYAFHPFANANTNVMLSHINRLKEQYDVTVLTENVSGKASKQESIDGINVIRYRKASFFRKSLYTFYYINTSKRRTFLKNLLVKSLHIFSLAFYRFFKLPEYYAIKKCLKDDRYKFIIATCESFASMSNVLELKLKGIIDCPWFSYFMDPHAYFVGNKGNNNKLIEIEKAIYKNSDLVFTTEEIYEENKTNALSAFIKKTVPIKFGNLRCIDYPVKKEFFEPRKINCVYIGSLLNESIRSPEYLYKLINYLDGDFCIHFVCNKPTKADIALRKRTLINNAIVKWYDYMPLEECLGIISNANVLINLGNKSANQTPSKIYDYIGSGRPIINIYSLENDTSKRQLDKYEYKLNIREDNDKIEENAMKFQEFCKSFQNSRMDKNSIIENYYEYLEGKTTSVFINKINEYLHLKSK